MGFIKEHPYIGKVGMGWDGMGWFGLAWLGPCTIAYINPVYNYSILRGKGVDFETGLREKVWIVNTDLSWFWKFTGE